MDYIKLLQKSLKNVVKEALSHASEKGFSGNHHFYITFKTNYPGVLMSKTLKDSYDEDMTIVLQYEFWNLNVFENFFEVDLKFSGVLEKFKIPFDSISRFSDPSESFVLDFLVENIDNENNESEDGIINLDSFRR